MKDEKGEPRWPYGYRVSWSIKELYENQPPSEGVPSTVKYQIEAPDAQTISQEIPSNIDQRLQASAVSLNEWEGYLDRLNLSPRSRKLILEEALSDLAESEHDALLACSSWWRQKALEHGDEFINAVITHYLYLSLRDRICEDDGHQKIGLVEKARFWKSRRSELEPLASAYVNSNPSVIKDSLDSKEVAISEYLNRAEVIREFLIYANEKICSTQSGQHSLEAWSDDRPVMVRMTAEQINDLDLRSQLEAFKRVACIIALQTMCEQNGWSLVSFCCETVPDSPEDTRPQLFQRLLTVIVSDAENSVVARAALRPYFDPYPMHALYHASAEGEHRTWQPCASNASTSAAEFITHLQDFANLEKHLRETTTDSVASTKDPDLQTQRMLSIFDYANVREGNGLNPFSHFRRMAVVFQELLGHDELADKFVTNHETPVKPVPSATLDTTAPTTPAALRIRAYNVGSQHSDDTPVTNTMARTDGKTGHTSRQVEVSQDDSDRAVLTHAVLAARDVDMKDGTEAVLHRLSSNNIPAVVVKRLLCNPEMIKLYGDPGLMKDPQDHSGVEGAIEYDAGVDDTAALVEALLQARDVKLTEQHSVLVAKLTSKSIPVDVAERAIGNIRIQNKKKRKHNTEETAAKKVKLEHATNSEDGSDSDEDGAAEDGTRIKLEPDLESAQPALRRSMRLQGEGAGSKSAVEDKLIDSAYGSQRDQSSVEPVADTVDGTSRVFRSMTRMSDGQA